MIRPEYLQTWFRAELPAGGWPQTFGIITACNPLGQPRSDEENTCDDARLREQLAVWPFVHRVFAGSRDFRHCEPSWAVSGISQEALRALGRAWRQDAVFWVKGDEVWVVCCDGPERQRAGDWSERLASTE